MYIQNKIKQIFSHYEEYIKQSFTKEELLHIFMKSPQILRFLFDKKIIKIDDSIIDFILQKKKYPLKIVGQYKNENMKIFREKMNRKKRYHKSIQDNYKYYFFLYIKLKRKNEVKEQIEKELIKKNENIFEDFENK